MAEALAQQAVSLSPAHGLAPGACYYSLQEEGQERGDKAGSSLQPVALGQDQVSSKLSPVWFGVGQLSPCALHLQREMDGLPFVSHLSKVTLLQ